jgi:guanylate kinase
MKNLITITGPSGSGKTELLKELTANYNFAKLVSVTDRKPRHNEVEGQDYYFISKHQFDEQEKHNRLIQTTYFNGQRYGTTIGEMSRILDLGKYPAVIVDTIGIPQFARISKTYELNHVSIYIECGQERLIKRYLQRLIHEGIGLDNVEYHAKRISSISTEMSWRSAWPYDFILSNNDDIIEVLKAGAKSIDGHYGPPSVDVCEQEEKRSDIDFTSNRDNDLREVYDR